MCREGNGKVAVTDDLVDESEISNESGLSPFSGFRYCPRSVFSVPSDGLQQSVASGDFDRALEPRFSDNWGEDESFSDGCGGRGSTR